jgi:hypothetical protein
MLRTLFGYIPSLENIVHFRSKRLNVVCVPRVLTYNVTEVDRFPALCQEQKAVEFLEEDSAGLMDGT